MNRLEDAFQRDFPGHRPFLTSRGSSALYLALAAIREERGPGEVVIPSTVCLSVPLAAVYAGLTPRFCDVELDTFCLSERTVLPCLGPDTRALLVVHLFGKTAPVGRLTEVARSRGLLIVEDVAQAAGGSLGNEPLGAFGDFSIFSFDEKKIIPGRGGALLVRDPKHHDVILRLHSELPLLLSALSVAELATSFRDLTTGIQGLLRHQSREETAIQLKPVLESYRALFLARPRDSEATGEEVYPAYLRLNEERKFRWANYALYEKHFAPGVKFVRFQREEMCWRLPVLLDHHDQQLLIVQKLRAAGILVSNHYFPASPFFGSRSPEIAQEIGLRAVNLWVDAKAEPDRIAWTCEQINSL